MLASRELVRTSGRTANGKPKGAISQEQGAQTHPFPAQRSIRKAPNAEWVAMYQKGIPTSKIASIEGVAESTVRYHLGIAARTEPDIKAEHKTSRGPVSPATAGGLQHMADTISFYEREGRLPSSNGYTPR